MDLELKEFGTTLAIGVYVCLGVLSLLYVSHRAMFRQIVSHLVTPFKKQNTLPSAAAALVSALLLFSLGLVGEDLSDKFSDDSDAGVFSWMFPESSLRAEVLFGSAYRNPLTKNHAALSIQFASSGRLSKYSDPQRFKQAREIELLIRAREPLRDYNDTKTLHDIANSVYYAARNVVFKIEAYNREMSSIQTRIGFARGLAFYSSIFAVISLFVLLSKSRGRVWRMLSWPGIITFVAVLLSLSLDAKWLPWIAAGTLGIFVYSIRRVRLAKRSLFIAFSSVYLITLTAYRYEEEEFNKRAYGYFATLADTDLPIVNLVNEHPINPPYPLSGITRLSNHKLLVVHDFKEHEGGPRVGMIDTSIGGGIYRPLEIKWRWPNGMEPGTSDIESVTPVGAFGFLMAESGWTNRPARLFRFSIVEENGAFDAEVLQIWQYPVGLTNIEGIASFTHKGTETGLFTADRNGIVHIANISFEPNLGPFPLEFTVSTNVFGSTDLSWADRFNRKITDLYLQGTNLWASAAHESGKAPFRSAIYRLGAVNPETMLVHLQPASQVELELQGFKIEGLTSGTEDSAFTIGTDDERFGGIWRELLE